MATLPIMMGASVISSLLGGLLGGKTAKEQAAGALNAANQSNQIQFQNQQLTRSDLAPYTHTGQAAITTLGNMLGLQQPGGGAGGPTADQQKQLSDLQTSQKWYEDVLAGRGAQGWNGGAPSNAATRAKLQGELDAVKRNITYAQEQIQNQTNQANLIAGQDKSQTGSLMKDFTLADFNADPGYNFRLAEGQKAIDRSAAARGGLFSGGTLKATDQYNQNFASNEFTNAYNRYQQNRQTKFNELATTAGIGQVSLGQQSNLSQQTANNIASSTAEGITSAANAQAAANANWGNSINQAVSNSIGIYANRNNINGGTGVPTTPINTQGMPPWMTGIPSSSSSRPGVIVN